MKTNTGKIYWTLKRVKLCTVPWCGRRASPVHATGRGVAVGDIGIYCKHHQCGNKLKTQHWRWIPVPRAFYAIYGCCGSAAARRLFQTKYSVELRRVPGVTHRCMNRAEVGRVVLEVRRREKIEVKFPEMISGAFAKGSPAFGTRPVKRSKSL